MTEAIKATDGPLISPTQLSVKRACRRKWAWTYIHGFRTPSTASQETGTRIHKQLENWLLNGVPPDTTREGQIALAGLKFLPKPSRTLDIEKKFYIKNEIAHFTGFIDCLDLSGERPLVLDHKTTKSDRYIKTPEELNDDPQAIIYSKHALDKTGAQEVDLRWVYYLTTGAPRAVATEQRFSLTFIDDKFNKVLEDAKEMKTLYFNKVSALDVEPTLEHCDAFGGCPHRERCFGKPATLTSMALDKKESIMGADDLLKQAKEMNASKGAVGVNPPDASKPQAPKAAAVPAQAPLDLGEIDKPKAVEPVAQRAPEPAPSLNVHAAAPAPEEKTGIVALFVDVFPIKDDYNQPRPVQLSTILGPMQELTAKQNGVEHYKLVEYGKGSAILASKLDQWFVESGFAGAIYASSFSDEFKAVQEVLFRRSNVIFKGI